MTKTRGLWNSIKSKIRNYLNILLILFSTKFFQRITRDEVKLNPSLFATVAKQLWRVLHDLKVKGSNSSVASPICQEGKVKEPSPIFAFSSRFFLFFSWFSPSFSRFLTNFSLSGVALCPLSPPVAMPLGSNPTNASVLYPKVRDFIPNCFIEL